MHMSSQKQTNKRITKTKLLWCLSHSHQTLNQASSWALPKTIQDTNLLHPNFSSPFVYKAEDNDGKPQSSDTEVSKLLGCTKDISETHLTQTRFQLSILHKTNIWWAIHTAWRTTKHHHWKWSIWMRRRFNSKRFESHSSDLARLR